MIQTPVACCTQRPGPTYRQAQSRQMHEEIGLPQVHLYDLSSPEGQNAFIQAARPYLSGGTGISPQPELEAVAQSLLEQHMLVDRFPLYLEDYFKLKRAKDWWQEVRHRQVLERAKRFYDRWDCSVIAEYPWEPQKRFVRLPPEDLFFEIAYSRNRHIFSPDLQAALRQQTFAIDGLGVGSAIAYLLVLCGTQHFIVADGGAVTLHDHNRLLGADVRESGINHAIHWARLALRTNPYLHIRCYPHNLSAHYLAEPHQEDTIGLQAFFEGATIIVEEADALLVKAAVRYAAKQAQVPVFMGADLGREGLVQYDSPDPGQPILNGRLTPQIWQELQTLSSFDFERVTRLAAEVFAGGESIPADYQRSLAEAAQAGTPFWPQVGMGAFASTRGTVEAILTFLEGKTPGSVRTENTEVSQIKGERASDVLLITEM